MSAEAKDREDDRAILTAALERATTDYRKKYPNPPILRPSPTKEILDALGEAIDRCKSYQGVAGKVLFNGTSGPIITPALLAPRLFDHSDRLNDQFEWKEDLPGAADWLIHLLTTEKTEGRFKVAVWGLSVAEELTIMEQTRILPFDALADSYMKSHILDRAKDNRGDVVWLSQRFYGRPGVAVETVVTDFPLIGTDGACFARIAKLQLAAKDFWSFIQAATVGRPLALCSWFDYPDRDLEFSEWDKRPDWILPEIHPRIDSSVSIEPSTVKGAWKDFMALPSEMQTDLLRSIDRFVLSRCRRQPIDQVLDLALAFEIAVGGGRGDNAPASWKVGVRSSQMIGGALDIRQKLRDKLNNLYRFRNIATHGGRMDSTQRADLQATINECSQIYVALIQSFLRLGAKPDWRRIELEPTSS